MINLKNVIKFCKDDPSEIENYQEAIKDKTQTWFCHHRDEVKILPSGMIATRSVEDLIENGRYFNCPANELIFLTKSAHSSLHCKIRNMQYDYSKRDETWQSKPEERRKRSERAKGRKQTDETKAKMKKAWEERRKKPISEKTRKKLSEAAKRTMQRPDVIAKLKSYEGEKNAFFGKHHSEETKAKMRAAWERRKQLKLK